MPQIKWLPEALADIERLHNFLYGKDPKAAGRAISVILKGSEALNTMPRAGRPMGDDTGRREWFVPLGAGAYVLRYMLEDDGTPVIIRVWHCRENWRG